MSLLGVLHGIGHEVGDDLLDASGVQFGFQCLVGVVLDELHPRCLHALCQRQAYLVEGFGEVHLLLHDLDTVGVECRYGEDIVDQSQQHVAVVHDHLHDLLLLFWRGHHGQHVGEAHDGVQRRTYLVGHIGHEYRLHVSRLVGALRLPAQLFLFLYQWCHVTYQSVGAGQLAGLIAIGHAVEDVPLVLPAFVEEGARLAEPCHGSHALHVLRVLVVGSQLLVEELFCQFVEGHLALCCRKPLVEGDGAVGERGAPESHVAAFHQVLQFLLVLLDGLALLAYLLVIEFVLQVELALLCDVADAEGDVYQFVMLVVDGV